MEPAMGRLLRARVGVTASPMQSRRRRQALRAWPGLRNELQAFQEYAAEYPEAGPSAFQDGYRFVRWLQQRQPGQPTCLL